MAPKLTVFHINKWLMNCLRVISNAWHFYYELCLVFKAVFGNIGIALLTLTGRYTHHRFSE
ncbi:hypothetical protein BSZ04_15365 [Vibrio rotiferianus]|nr:DUF3265 domain-containing protein [Vibrio rotiferianus]ASI96338.1 hypothetical protein BSZ04_15365 [Vibrio rotiferianus]